MDRVIVAGHGLEGGELRLGHGAARKPIDLADFEIVKRAPRRDIERLRIEFPRVAYLDAIHPAGHLRL
jgi:hypothetical protein